ncbi:hypothetical protein GCM10009619_14350 [Williamsia maris]
MAGSQGVLLRPSAGGLIRVLTIQADRLVPTRGLGSAGTMAHDDDNSPHRVFDPSSGKDPDTEGVADGDDVPSPRRRGSSDDDEGTGEA